ncbi:MAG TPA: type I glyceraldehyde-3-phosphate dehydrogenase [Chloroflexota bacterium]|jgi:glyceraldehyde 3-phosphate dehydrogenase
MTVRVGVNGFGRIGRQVVKAILERHPSEVELVAVNDLATPEENAHLFKYDSNYGVYPGTVEARDGHIVVGGRSIRVLAERDPAQLPWADLGVQVVVESTGRFTDASKAAVHLAAGARKVVITAPAKNEDLTIVLGVNQDAYDPARHHVISNASCTTNCLAPVAKVINDHFGIERGLMTTVHSYTNDQRILDVVHDDPRRARSAAMNIIPTSTGAARAVALVIPELRGKFHGLAMRVPTSTVSMVDFVADLEREATAEDVNAVLRDAAGAELKGILSFSEEPLVSSDFRGNPASSIVDGPLTMSIGGNMIKVMAWYDNEWGYSCRVADLVVYLDKRGL